MSKVSMPRPRYLGFTLQAAAPLSRRTLANALRAAARQEGWSESEGPHLTRFAWPHAIVRVEHGRQAAARRLLCAISSVQDGNARVPVAVRTDGASGTLKALTTRVGYLRERGDDKPAPAGPGPGPRPAA